MKFLNKKKLYVLIGSLMVIFAITSAQASTGENSICDQYIERAEIEAEFPYPDYFKSGENYLSAARCYDRIGEDQKSYEAYLEAAEKFELAPQHLTGDHFIAAKSYEKSALSYEMIGETSKAVEVYEKSIQRYNSGGHSEEADRIQNRIDSLQEDTSKMEKIQTNFGSIIGLVSLIVLFASLSLLFVIALANFLPIKTGDSDNDIGTFSDEFEEEKKEPKVEKPRKTKKSKSPRQRAIEKLREKYKP